MSDVSLDKYQSEAWKTMRKDLDRDGKLLNCALGLGEAGEVQNLIKKAIFHNHGLTTEIQNKIIDELGDVLWYVACTAETLGYNLSEIAIRNIDKLRKRYPDQEFKAEHSIYRKI